MSKTMPEVDSLVSKSTKYWSSAGIEPWSLRVKSSAFDFITMSPLRMPFTAGSRTMEMRVEERASITVPASRLVVNPSGIITSLMVIGAPPLLANVSIIPSCSREAPIYTVEPLTKLVVVLPTV